MNEENVDSVDNVDNVDSVDGEYRRTRAGNLVQAVDFPLAIMNLPFTMRGAAIARFLMESYYKGLIVDRDTSPDPHVRQAAALFLTDPAEMTLGLMRHANVVHCRVSAALNGERSITSMSSEDASREAYDLVCEYPPAIMCVVNDAWKFLNDDPRFWPKVDGFPFTQKQMRDAWVIRYPEYSTGELIAEATALATAFVREKREAEREGGEPIGFSRN